MEKTKSEGSHQLIFVLVLARRDPQGVETAICINQTKKMF
jgi:hypothetical protein